MKTSSNLSRLGRTPHYLLLLITLALLAWFITYEKEIDTTDWPDENWIIEEVIRLNVPDSGYVIVEPYTHLDVSFGPKKVKINTLSCDRDELTAMLVRRNLMPYRLELESDQDCGYIVDYDNTLSTYFSGDDEIGGWPELYRNHPNSKGISLVSMPAFDPECGVLLVYMRIQMYSLHGEGWLITYQLTDSTLVELDRLTVWIS